MTQFSAIVFGNESLTQACAERLLARGHAISALVTRNEALAGWAKGQGIRVEAPGAGSAERLGDLRADWLLSIANLSVIPDAVLALARNGAVNFHDGPLPRHAGLNAPVWALAEGETRHGISWHMIEGGIDEGDILVQRHFDIAAGDTALTLNAKCFAAGVESFPALLDQLETGAPERVAQDLARRSYHARDKRPAFGGCLDWRLPAAALERLVRALDHGQGYRNPVTMPKMVLPDRVEPVTRADLAEGAGPAGKVLANDGASVTIACGTGALRVFAGSLSGISAGIVLPPPDDDLTRVANTAAPAEPFWRNRLAGFAPLDFAGATGTMQTHRTDARVSLAHAAALALRLAGSGNGGVAFAHPGLTDAAATGLVAPWVPMMLETAGFGDFAEKIEAETALLRGKPGFAADLPLRDPVLAGLATPDIALSDNAGPVSGAALTIELTGTGAVIHHADADMAAILAGRLAHLAAGAAPDTPVAELPILPQAERDAVLNRWNDTTASIDTRPLHRLFEAQAAQTPDAPALVFEGKTLTYAQLNSEANRIAHVLQSMGVGPDTIVGLCTRRSAGLVAAALGILKAGGAYLPMDPAYPAERLGHFVDDSRCPVIVSETAVAPDLPRHDAQVLLIDADPRLSAADQDNLPDSAGPDHLAYMIYTSGSTGKPKGVMVEHRNVANFFTGMDACVTRQDGDTWLAVTSLSFDISVLELFYTLARGFKVVITSDEDRGLISNGPVMATGGMEFSLYYWGNDDGVGSDKYRTLLEGAKFADDNGFVAVWTPERHFHAFGGPYPNPSVTGAAVAAVTKNIGVRAGSCVAPLHHPARIAEEWAVIDNLTNGRAGLAIASGWQPDDFVLRPENTPPDNKPAMIDYIDIVRRLWRGEAVGFPKKDGALHEVVTQPRPVSKDLPVWVTTAGNPETWKEAGRLGAHVLTHLLGQSVDEVAAKIKLYHAALREAGHDPADFTVTLMLHSFLADTRDAAREIAREPMKDYLRSAAGLIKQYAWAFPAFKKPEGVKNPFELDLGSLSEDELEGILDFAFERYFNDSGLFGTVEDALARVAQCKAIGVTEIACLIDYGIAADVVLDGLRPLARVVAEANRDVALAEDDYSIAAQIVRHKVTHLQCTPSMARMIAMNDEARAALNGVKHVFLGGEPLPGALVADFATITQAPITNMYGPTETTIWSATERAAAEDGVVNIGLPIANTQLYVLDEDRQPVGIGMDGELWIGGDGVTRGYWQRPDLTAERFAENPYHEGRMYRTGDLVRRRADGRIDFIGRVDHQVKLRGHRIELGEIEAALEAQPGVSQAVAMAREDTPGDIRLIGYYTGPSDLPEAALKASLGAALPDYMVPGRFMRVDAFPLTPNKKVDRNALPAPSAPKSAPPQPTSLPVSPAAQPSGAAAAEVEARVAAIWRDVLGVDGITARDNFFDLGGHSLLAVQTHRTIRDQLGAARLSITDIFRFPTLGALSARVAEFMETVNSSNASPGPAPVQDDPANDRARVRADAMARRREMRARRRA